MDFDNVIPRTRIYDKLTGRSFFIYEPLHDWCRGLGLNYNHVKDGTDERYKVVTK